MGVGVGVVWGTGGRGEQGVWDGNEGLRGGWAEDWEGGGHGEGWGAGGGENGG